MHQLLPSPRFASVVTCRFLHLHSLFQRLLGREPPPPLQMSVPVAPLSQQLSDFLSRPGIERIVEDWRERKVIPGELNCIMDDRVGNEILGRQDRYSERSSLWWE